MMRYTLGLFILCISSACGFVLESGSRNVTKILKVTNGGPYGTWSQPEFCPAGLFASGYSSKVEANQFRGDDTALNSIRLTCTDNTGHAQAGYQVTSGQGPFGTWSNNEDCSQQRYLVGFSLQVEGQQGSGDDTSANYVKFYCRDFHGNTGVTELNHPPGTGSFGKFGSWSPNCGANAAICGLETRIESSQGGGDDTALNDVIFYCCSDGFSGVPVGK